MFDVILITVVLLAAGGGCLYWVFTREQREQKANFRRALRHEIKRTRLKGFDFSAFVEQAGVSRELAEDEAADIYADVYARAVADGRITDKEQTRLERFAKKLEIPAKRRGEIEQNINSETYRSRVQEALADGVLTDEEAAELAELQAELGLSGRGVLNATGKTARDAYLAHFRAVVQRGEITQDDLKELKRLRGSLGLTNDHAQAIVHDDMLRIYRDTFCMVVEDLEITDDELRNLSRLREILGLNDEQARSAVRDDALRAYREMFYEFKQDGHLSDFEEQQLNTLQKLAALSDRDVRKYQQEIGWIKHLENCRNGNLPVVITGKMLDGGEICHADEPCTFMWKTSRTTKEATGELTVSDRRIIFTSPHKNFEFRLGKVVDMELYSDALRIQTSGSRGTGYYLVGRPDEFEAILTALVKRQKYLEVEGFSSSTSRHIPQHVKHDVWARDGGKCVQCGATDYLEFDHIIPHSKGGANTVNNIQVLCRGCNAFKADRV